MKYSQTESFTINDKIPIKHLEVTEEDRLKLQSCVNSEVIS